MIGKCKHIHVILGIVIVALALWPNIIGAVASKWIIVVAGALILIHSFKCTECGMCENCGVNLKKGSGRKKRR